MELPPAFSEKERAELPLLAREDTNPIFDAFRRRRKVHSRRFSIPLSNFSNTSFLLRVILTIVGLAGTAGLFVLTLREGFRRLPPGFVAADITSVYLSASLVTAAAVAFVAVVLSVMARLSARGKPPRRLVPRLCSNVFSRRGAVNDLTLDLHLAGVSGAGLAEAIFLEGMEGFRTTSRAAWSMGAALVIAFIAWRVGLDRISSAAFCAALLWLAWEARDLMWWGKMNLVRAGRIRTLLSDWSNATSSHAQARAIRSGIVTGLLYTALFLMAIALLAACMFAAGSMVGALGRTRWWSLEPWETILLAGAVGCAMMAAISHFAIPAMIRREGRLLERDLVRADEVFDRYARTAVIKDPDSADLSRAEP